MTYDEACAAAKAGKAMERRHWGFVVMRYRDDGGGLPGLFIEHDDGKVEPWWPDEEAGDDVATDWSESRWWKA